MNLDAIKDAVGPKGWLEDENDTLKYRQDWRGRVTGEMPLLAGWAQDGIGRVRFAVGRGRAKLSG